MLKSLRFLELSDVWLFNMSFLWWTHWWYQRGCRILNFSAGISKENWLPFCGISLFGCFVFVETCYCSSPPAACPCMVPWPHTSTLTVTSMKLWQYTKLTTLTWWAGLPPCTAGFQGNYSVLMVFTSHNAFETYIKCTHRIDFQTFHKCILLDTYLPPDRGIGMLLRDILISSNSLFCYPALEIRRMWPWTLP